MGLDSVELLIEIENYFAIQIPDAEAEKIYTIQNMVDSVAAHLNISSNDTNLKDSTFKRIIESFPKSDLLYEQIKLTDNISQYISPDNKQDWNYFENKLGLDIPKPDIIKFNGVRFSDKIKKLLSWQPLYDWSTITVDHFVDVVCANNYIKLINRKKITSKYEIYIVVVGITVEKIGVEYYEISPDKSFTSDLGVE